ncbi:MAG: RHS repeat-associated core domain-containing protein [Opitutaceae bacterium]|nr:RHS repeat-associated core domain-containing protein [Opitutaceae bacterium]
MRLIYRLPIILTLLGGVSFGQTQMPQWSDNLFRVQINTAPGKIRGTWVNFGYFQSVYPALWNQLVIQRISDSANLSTSPVNVNYVEYTLPSSSTQTTVRYRLIGKYKDTNNNSITNNLDRVVIYYNASDVAAPDAVTNLAAVNRYVNDIQVGWTAPAATDIARYLITYAAGSWTRTFYVYRFSNGSLPTSFRISDNSPGLTLNPGTSYTITVVAEDYKGNQSATATTVAQTRVNDTVAPTAPGTITATPAAESASLSWGGSTDPAPSSGNLTYNVSVTKTSSGLVVATFTGLTTTNVNIASGLEPITGYTVSITCKDDNGNVSQPKTTTFTTLDIAPPSGFAATSVTSNSVTLGWSKGTLVERYRVYLNTILIEVPYANAPTCTFSSVIPGITYTASIESVSTTGRVSARTSIQVTTPQDATPDTTAPSIAPQITGVHAVTSTSLSLSWSKAVDDRRIAKYQIDCNGVTYENVESSGLPPATTKDLSGIAASTNSDGSTFRLKVRAIDGGGNPSAWSSEYRVVPPAPLTALTPGTLPTALPTLVGKLEGGFYVDSNGNANASYKLPIAPGRGFSPGISANYSSGGSNGIMGVGWSISTGFPTSITRGRSIRARDGVTRGILFDDSLDNLYLDGKRLVCVSGTKGSTSAVYRTEVDSFCEIRPLVSGALVVGYQMQTKDGSTYYFGQVDGTLDGFQRAGGETNANIAYSFALKKVVDARGYIITFSYTDIGAEYVLSRITYADGNGVSAQAYVDFLYETTRQDAPITYLTGRYFNHHARLKSIKSSAQNPDISGISTFSQFVFQYQEPSFASPTASARSRLTSIESYFTDPTTYEVQRIPDTTFQWSNSTEGLSTTPTTLLTANENANRLIWLADGTGTDKVRKYTQDPAGSATTLKPYDPDGDGITRAIEFKIDGLNISDGGFITSGTQGDFGWSVDQLFSLCFSNSAIQLAQNILPGRFLQREGGAFGGRVSIGDFDGDGKDDILAHGYDGKLYVSYNGPTGVAQLKSGFVGGGSTFASFGSSQLDFQYLIGSEHKEKFVSPMVVDLNGDGMKDYVFTSKPRVFHTASSNVLYNIRSSEMTAVLSKGDGFSEPVSFNFFPAPPVGAYASADNRYMKLDDVLCGAIPGDFNGDGLTDFLVLDNKNIVNRRWLLFLSKGSDASGKPLFEMVPGPMPDTFSANGYSANTYHRPVINDAWENLKVPRVPSNHPDYQNFSVIEGSTGSLNTLVMDANGDGLDDLVWYTNVTSDGTLIEAANRSWWVMFSQGSFKINGAFGAGFSAPVKMTAFSGLPIQDPKLNSTNQYITNLVISRLADWDGDGHPDYYVQQNNGGVPSQTCQIYRNTATTFADLIVGVTDGFGSRDTIEYKSGKDATIYTRGASVSFPIRNAINNAPVVSALNRDSGGTASAQFTYQYAGYRVDMSGRGALGYQAFVTRDVQNGVLKYQFLTQSFPMTGMTAREQTFKELSASQLRLVKSQTNSIVFDRVVVDGSTYGTVYPFVVKSTENRWEYTPTAHYNLVDPTTLYTKSLPSNAYVTVTSRSWFDSMDTSSSEPWTLGGAGIEGYYTSDDNAGSNSPNGKSGSTGTFQTFLNSFPGQISYGNLKCLATDYGSGFTEKLDQTYETPVGLLTGRVKTQRTTVVSPGYGTQLSPLQRFTYVSGTPLVQTETVDAADNKLDLTTTYNYSYARVRQKVIDGYSSPGDLQHIGQIVAESVPDAANDFDSRFDLPKKTQNALGHIVQTVYNGLNGLAVRVTDSNSQVTSTTYDSVGRPISVTDSLGITTSSQYVTDTSVTVSPPATVTAQSLTSSYRVDVTQTQKPDISAYYDRLGRKIRTIRSGYNNLLSIQDTLYDDNDRVVAVSNPYPSGSTPSWTTTVYDEFGRVKTVTAPNGTTTTNTYNGKIVTVTVVAPEAGTIPQVNATQTDAKGRTIKVWNNDNPVSLTNGETGDTTTTPSIAFTLDGFGRMRVTTLKGQAQTITADYDEIGNQIQLVDPDKGTWNYVANGLGQVVKQTDLKSQVTESRFDLIRRPLSRTIKASASVTEETTRWYYYDNVVDAANQRVTGTKGWIGAVQSQETITTTTGYKVGTTTPPARTIYYYTNKGLPEIVLNEVDGKYFYTHTSYDSYYRPSASTHYWRPSQNENVSTMPYLWQNFGYSYTYDNKGYITKITDNLGRPWWEASGQAYDHMDRLVQVKKGNSHVTVRGYRNTDGVLTSINTGNGTVQNLSFTWDGLGNLTSRTDPATVGSGPTTETFGYDNLNRLEKQNGAIVARYQSNGNVSAKAGVGIPVDSADFDYHAARPHAVKTARGYTFTYDVNGNLISRTHTTAGDLAVTWSGFDMPRLMTLTTGTTSIGMEFQYNGNHSRVLELEYDAVAAGVPSHYTKKRIYGMGSLLELNYDNLASSGQQWVMKKVRVYVPGPEGVIGCREFDPSAGPSLTGNEKALVYHYDHLGSIAKITVHGDQTSSLAKSLSGKVGSYAYDPWGLRSDPFTRSSAPSSTAAGDADDLTPRGYTGHEMLNRLGLIHMNGRIYDPKIGRFLSADILVQNPGSLQSYNRYSYVWNNPLRYTDPSGFEIGDKDAAENEAERRRKEEEKRKSEEAAAARRRAESEADAALWRAGRTVVYNASYGGSSAASDSATEAADTAGSATPVETRVVSEKPVPDKKGKKIANTSGSVDSDEDVVAPNSEPSMTNWVLNWLTDGMWGYDERSDTMGKNFTDPALKTIGKEAALFVATNGALRAGGAALSYARGAFSAGGGLTRIGRFFYDNRAFRTTISREYWSGTSAGGSSLHHWLIPQRWTWVPQGIRNGGWNLLELPPMRGVFHESLGLNQWMGFARNWGSGAAFQASAVENTIRVGVPALSYGAAAGGYYLGVESYNAIMDSSDH